VLGHLVALVPGQGSGHLAGQVLDRGGQCVGHDVGLVAGAGRLDQDHEPGRPLHQGRDRAHLFAEDQVSFPVPGHRSVFCFGRAFGDVQDARPVAATIGQAGARRPSDLAPSAQVSGQLLA
jgi:hypothetical protein